MSRLALLANPHRNAVSRRTLVATAIRGRVSVNPVLGVPDHAPFRCANASQAQKHHLVSGRVN
jgi:hypothetical protein